MSFPKCSKPLGLGVCSRVQGLGLGVQGLGFRVHRVQGLGCIGFRVFIGFRA